MRKTPGGQSARRRGPFFWPLLWAAGLALVSGGLCFVPLFDLLGYELALAVAPLCGVAALHLGLREVAHARAAWGWSAREAADARPFQALLGLAGRTGGRMVPALATPIVIMGLNALRVRNCNPAMGLLWYAVLPVGSAAFGACLGVALGALHPRLAGARAALGGAVGVLLIAAGWSLLRLYAAPPIFVFDPLFGYFAGSVYDEHVAIPGPLWWARAYHAAMALALLACAARPLDGHVLAARRSPGAPRRSALGPLALVALSLTLYAAGPRLGFRHDAASIAAALGGERRTDHFVVHYAPDGPFAKELDDVLLELELDHAQLADALGVAPRGPVHAFLFSSATQKQALMGAGRTLIAKPWRGEIYVNHEPFPQPVLAHELAHVFGALDGDRLLGVARDGLRLDVGLIEGFAEALTWHGATLLPDEAVRVLDRLERRPPLAAVMSPRFWSLPAQQAYAVAGSFCRFLLERGGAAALRALYRAGGARAAYATLYGADFPALEREWLARIAHVELDDGALERERDRILRPSIFRRPCARELARRLEDARARSARGDHAGARALYEEVCADEPDDPGHLDELLVEAARSGDHPGARAIASRLLAHAKASAAQRGAARSVLGDLLAAEGRFADAMAAYRLAEAEPAEPAISRLYTVKRILAGSLASLPPTTKATPRHAALDVLARGGRGASDEHARLTRAAIEAPDDGLLAYLAARQHLARGELEATDARLARALDGGLPDDRFVREAERLRAEVAFRRGDYAAAARRFDALATHGSAAARRDAAQWADRARFFGAHRTGP